MDFLEASVAMETVVKLEIKELDAEITKAVLLSTKTVTVHLKIIVDNSNANLRSNNVAHSTTQTPALVAAINVSKELLNLTKLHVLKLNASKKLFWKNAQPRWQFMMNSNPREIPHADHNSITTT